MVCMLLLASIPIPFFVIGEFLKRSEKRPRGRSEKRSRDRSEKQPRGGSEKRPRGGHSRADRLPLPEHKLTKPEHKPPKPERKLPKRERKLPPSEQKLTKPEQKLTKRERKLPPPDHKLTKRERDPRAPRLKAMLLTLYEPKYDFLLGVTDLRPSTRMGFYTSYPYYRITVHGGWNNDTEISIHEYAHHLARTELNRKIRSHGREFKTIYSILMDAYNSKYAFIQPDRRYYLAQNKRLKDVTLDIKK